MGTIKVDTITPLATNSEVTIASNKFVGTASGTMTVVGEGGTTQTNLQQGLAKMFVHSDAAASINDSLNVSGSTDNGTGDYSYAYTNNMRANDTYPSNFALLENQIGACYQRTNDADQVRTDVVNGDGSANRDRVHGGKIVGDLA